MRSSSKVTPRFCAFDVGVMTAFPKVRTRSGLGDHVFFMHIGTHISVSVFWHFICPGVRVGVCKIELNWIKLNWSDCCSDSVPAACSLAVSLYVTNVVESPNSVRMMRWCKQASELRLDLFVLPWLKTPPAAHLYAEHSIPLFQASANVVALLNTVWVKHVECAWQTSHEDLSFLNDNRSLPGTEKCCFSF